MDAMKKNHKHTQNIQHFQKARHKNSSPNQQFTTAKFFKNNRENRNSGIYQLRCKMDDEQVRQREHLSTDIKMIQEHGCTKPSTFVDH